MRGEDQYPAPSLIHDIEIPVAVHADGTGVDLDPRSDQVHVDGRQQRPAGIVFVEIGVAPIRHEDVPRTVHADPMGIPRSIDVRQGREGRLPGPIQPALDDLGVEGARRVKQGAGVIHRHVRQPGITPPMGDRGPRRVELVDVIGVVLGRVDVPRPIHRQPRGGAGDKVGPSRGGGKGRGEIRHEPAEVGTVDVGVGLVDRDAVIIVGRRLVVGAQREAADRVPLVNIDGGVSTGRRVDRDRVGAGDRQGMVADGGVHIALEGIDRGGGNRGA